MEDLLNKLQNEPIALIVIAALAVGIAFLFMIPVFINYLKSFGLSKIKADDKIPEVAETEEKEEKPKKEEKAIASEAKKSDLKLPKFRFKLDFKKKSPKTMVLAVIALLIVVGAGYFTYDFFFRPVRIMSAWQVRIERFFQLNKLQEGDLGSWQEAKIYLLDIRSRKTFESEHLIKSGCLPANEARDYFYPIDGISLVIYSDKFSLDSARETADAIAERGDSGKIKYDNPGQIIIIKDGFEGLKATGLKTENGQVEGQCD